MKMGDFVKKILPTNKKLEMDLRKDLVKGYRVAIDKR